MRRRHRAAPFGDDGSAIIEFVFAAVVVMVPLVYLIVAVAAVQRSGLAVSQAAREAGRAFATSPRAGDATLRARAAVRIALTDQGLADDVTLRYVAAGSGCDTRAIKPRLQPGSEFTVCVSRRTVIPGVPSVLAGRGIKTVGRYVVHIDDYRTVAP